MLAIICALGGLISLLIAAHRGRHPAWLFVGLLLPLISIVILLALPPIPVEEAKQPS
jgi:hypothetical protein